MTTPAQAAQASGGESILSTALKVLGIDMGVQATQAMSDYRARVAEINAGIAREQANVEVQSGEIRAQTAGVRTAERIGATRAGFGAGNLSLGSGSPQRVVSSEREVGAFEQATIRSDAARRAYASNVRAFGDEAQATLERSIGAQAKRAEPLDIASSILGGATSVSDKWAKYGESFGNAPITTTGADFGVPADSPYAQYPEV